MLADMVRFDWLERSCPYMQGDEFPFDAQVGQALQDLRREMQAGGRGGYRAVVTGKDRLVAFGIGIFRLAVDIGRKRHFPCLFQDFRKAQMFRAPGKFHLERILQAPDFFHSQFACMRVLAIDGFVGGLVLARGSYRISLCGIVWSNAIGRICGNPVF